MEGFGQELLAWKGLVVVVWLAVFFIGERLAPAAVAPRPERALGVRQRAARNLGLWVVNIGLSQLIVVPLSFWASSVALHWRPYWWSAWPGLLLDLLLLDFLIYWWHRANHAVPLLWRFHEAHRLNPGFRSPGVAGGHISPLQPQSAGWP